MCEFRHLASSATHNLSLSAAPRLFVTKKQGGVLQSCLGPSGSPDSGQFTGCVCLAGLIRIFSLSSLFRLGSVRSLCALIKQQFSHRSSSNRSAPHSPRVHCSALFFRSHHPQHNQKVVQKQAEPEVAIGCTSALYWQITKPARLSGVCGWRPVRRWLRFF